MMSVRYDIVEIPFMLHCTGCGRTGRGAGGVRVCPECGSSDTTIVSGTEMRVVELELDEDEE